MNGGQLPGGRDILEIANQLDQMQRDYLNQGHSGVVTQKLPKAPAVFTSEQQMLAQSEGKFEFINDGLQVSGAQSHFGVNGHNAGLQNDARTNSGGKRLVANSEANDSVDAMRRDNWVEEE